MRLCAKQKTQSPRNERQTAYRVFNTPLCHKSGTLVNGPCPALPGGFAGSKAVPSSEIHNR